MPVHRTATACQGAACTAQHRVPAQHSAAQHGAMLHAGMPPAPTSSKEVDVHMCNALQPGPTCRLACRLVRLSRLKVSLSLMI
jgi:hypothetical protein